MLIRSLRWDAALRAGKCSELLGNSTCKLIQTLLLVRHVNLETLHHQERFRTHFFPVSCCKEAVLYNRVGVNGVYYKLEGNWLGYADRVEKYLQVTCLELCPHGRLLQCYQPGCQPCFFQPRGWRSSKSCVTLDSPVCGSWGNVISCCDLEQLARNSSDLWFWKTSDRNIKMEKVYDSRKCKGLLCQTEFLK